MGNSDQVACLAGARLVGAGPGRCCAAASTARQRLFLACTGRLVGLDKAAATQALAGFMRGKVLTANQIEFVQTVIENLTKAGVMDPSRLYEAPYTRMSAKGVEGVFQDAEVIQLIAILDDVWLRAVA